MLAFWGLRWFRDATASEGMGASRLPTWARASIAVAVAVRSGLRDSWSCRRI